MTTQEFGQVMLLVALVWALWDIARKWDDL